MAVTTAPRCMVHKRPMKEGHKSGKDVWQCPVPRCAFTRSRKAGPVGDPLTNVPSNGVPKKRIKAPVLTQGTPRDSKLRAQTGKVRKPKCPQHQMEMEFDSAKTVWTCPDPTCLIISRPKEEVEQGRVTLGQGKIEMRYILQPDGSEPRVVLIADNNVSLDITDYVATDALGDQIALSDVVEMATSPEARVDMSTHPFDVMMKIVVTVMGIDIAED